MAKEDYIVRKPKTTVKKKAKDARLEDGIKPPTTKKKGSI